MGTSVKFNWVLQIVPPDSITVQSAYNFEKSGNRVFPLDTAIDLIDLNREAIAKIRITSYQNVSDSTMGRFEVVKIYSGTEKSVLSNYWAENE